MHPRSLQNLTTQRSTVLDLSTELLLKSRDRLAYSRERHIADTRRPRLKWQVITTPVGLFFRIFGPFEGRRHDRHMYAESGLDEIPSEELLIDGVVRVPTYTCNDTCIALSGRVQRHL
jgi:hypothetical protein